MNKKGGGQDAGCYTKKKKFSGRREMTQACECLCDRRKPECGGDSQIYVTIVTRPY